MASSSVGAVNDTDWPTYLNQISTNQSEISRAAGVSSATVSRWLSRSSRPLAPQVIAVARAYDQSPVLALVAAGYLTRAEIEEQITLTPGMTLAEFTELEIAEELVRRIEAGQSTDVSDTPLNVDHPAWAPVDVRRAADDEHEVDLFSLAVVLNHNEVEFRTAEGNVFNDVDDAFRELRNRIVHHVGGLESLPHAAKNRAREVEEDQHTT
jgi:transcriptional regulator with XRE-family HTH domain